MVDGLALCSCACVTCLWCSLLAVCFPKFFKKLQESESSDCCAVYSGAGKNLSRVIGKCEESSVKNKAKTELPCEKISGKPKCTVRIIRKTRLQCQRKKSPEEEIAGGNFDSKKRRRTCCSYNVDCIEAIDSGVQTEIYQRSRNRLQRENCECDDLADRNKRCKLHDRQESDFSLI